MKKAIKKQIEKKVKEVKDQEADLQERITKFNDELRPLLGKYELGIAAMPKIMPDGRVSADPIIVSMRQQPQAMTNPQK